MTVVVGYVPRPAGRAALRRAAAETGAALIVIGIRRCTAVGKLIMGSTSQRILLEADCPVLAVKASRVSV